MRRLIVIRIVHAPADMGSASTGLEKDGISALGKQAWEENQKTIMILRQGSCPKDEKPGES